MMYPKVQVIIDLLKEVPESGFRMQSAGVVNSIRMQDIPEGLDWHSCATPACIGGWATYHLAMNTHVHAYDVYMELRNRNNLGLKSFPLGYAQYEYPAYTNDTHPHCYDRSLHRMICVGDDDLASMQETKIQIEKEKETTVNYLDVWRDDRVHNVGIEAALAYICEIPIHDAARICYPSVAGLGEESETIRIGVDTDHEHVIYLDKLIYKHATVAIAVKMLEHYRDTGAIKWDLDALIAERWNFLSNHNNEYGDA